ncbi:MAG: hypothetical protein RL722_658 [Pseudomonadota bacterium]
MPTAILLIEDEAILAKNICLYLDRSGFEVTSVETAEAGMAALDEFRPDAVVLDFNLPGMDGLRALSLIHERDPHLPVVMITGHGHVELAVEAMKAGAADFMTKPVALSKLQVVLEKVIGQVRRDDSLAYFNSRGVSGEGFAGLLGQSPPMLQLKNTIFQLVEAEHGLQAGEAPAVLVLGETGAGKELVSRAIHFGGPRKDKPFVELNCAALPAQLLESELFGHERGAFTDAKARKLGLVETAEGGTLFLDEIGDMDLSLQAKLLKLLEDKTVRRIGSIREQSVNVRIIAATHQPLEDLVRQGRFRADLYFRLAVVQFKVPPLRDRSEDITELAEHFIDQHSKRYGKSRPTLTAAARARLASHRWPGNVRELRNVLDQAVLLCRGSQIEANQLPISENIARTMTASAERPSPVDPQDGKASPTALLASAFPATELPPRDRTTSEQKVVESKTSFAEIERQALIEALGRARWNVSRAARELQISRDTLRYRMVKHGLNGNDGGDSTELGA